MKKGQLQKVNGELPLKIGNSIIHVSRSIQFRGKNAEIWYNEGKRFEKSNSEYAIYCFQKTTFLKKNHWDALFHLAHLKSFLNKKISIKYFLNGIFYFFYSEGWKGIEFILNGSYFIFTKTDYLISLIKEPNNQKEKAALGYLFFLKKDYKGARNIFSTISEKQLKDIVFYLCKGYSEGQTGNLSECEKTLTKGINIDSSFSPIHTVRGMFLIQQSEEIGPAYNKSDGKKKFSLEEKAIECFDIAIELNPNNFEAFFHRGLAKAQTKGTRKGIEDLEKAISLSPQDNPKFYFHRGKKKSSLSSQSGLSNSQKVTLRKEAIEDFTKVIEINPKNYWAYQERGMTKINLGEKEDDIIQDFNKAIEVNPEFSEPYLYRGEIKMRLGLFKSTIKDFTKVIEISTEAPVLAFHKRAESKEQIGDFRGAKRDWEKMNLLIEKEIPDN